MNDVVKKMKTTSRDRFVCKLSDLKNLTNKNKEKQKK
jgi:hypothetical protein